MNPIYSFFKIKLKTSILRKSSELIDRAMPFIDELASVLCDALRASSDYAQCDDKDSDGHLVLVASVQKCSITIHQLIQIFAIDTFDQNPATLACIQVIIFSREKFLRKI